MTMQVGWEDRRLGRLATESRRAAAEFIEVIALQAAADAQQNIRTIGAIDTGFMVNTTRARRVGQLVWSIGTAAFYGVFIEFGTRSTSPRPWLTPAINKAKQRLRVALGKMLRDI